MNFSKNTCLPTGTKKAMSVYSFLMLAFLAKPAFAQPTAGTTGLEEAGTIAGLSDLFGGRGIKGVIGLVIKGLLSLLGMVFLILVIWGGFKWMTSQGNADKIKEAKGLIVNAAIGLAIVVTSYVIVIAVFKILGEGPRGPDGEGGN